MELGEFSWDRTDKHVPHEQRVPSIGRDESDRESIRRICSCQQVLDEYLTGIEIAPDVLLEAIEGIRIKPGILLPPDPVLPTWLLNQKLVLGGASRMRRRN